MHGFFYDRVVRIFFSQLYQQAFLQAACANTGRVKTLYHFQHVLNLFILGQNILRKCKVIGKRSDRPAQVTIIIQDCQ